MRPLIKGIAVAAIHVCLIGTLGAKLVYDRATLPRVWASTCLLYTSDAADDLLCVDLGGRRIIKKKTEHTSNTENKTSRH
mgnify:CR=1 FL=1